MALNPGYTDLDLSATAAYPDHMHWDYTYDGSDWLFGSTRSLDSNIAATEIYFWRTTIDFITGSFDALSSTVHKVNGLTGTGHVLAVKPVWDN